MRAVEVINEVLHDLLAHVQTLAILLAALIAADFFVFTPTVTSNVVQEYRVDTAAVDEAYAKAGEQVPSVVLSTLADIANRSIPIGQSATVLNSGGPGPRSTQVAATAPGAAVAPAAATSSVYAMAEICAKSRVTVESVVAGACTVGQPDRPLYERALFHYDEESSSPLGPDQLHEAIARMADAVFTRATVTLSNPGKATAQNVNIIVPDGYTKRAGTLPLSLDAGERSDFLFDSLPGALSSNKGALVTSPTFTVKWDPTGPLDPQFSLRVVLGFAVLLVVLVVLDTIEAIRDDDDDDRRRRRKARRRRAESDAVPAA
ncbi:MAG TPA: hypothetical protein VE953_08920 [Terriglobales bacterium]|nr:hypothetical protein [Terriglobales bacterium]